MPASLHIGDGFARIGGVTIPGRASVRGLELGGDAFFCPVSFGLRSRLVAWSGDNLGEALLAESLKGPAEGLEPLALQALALHLAGAASGAPGFISAAALVARLLGWPLAAINDAEALEVDRLAASLAPAMDQAADDGWTTVVFSGGPAGNGEDEPLDAICARLTADLQRRGTGAISPAEAAILSGATPVHRQQSDWPKASASGAEGFGAVSENVARAAATVDPATRPAGAPNIDPPPDPWRGAAASPGAFPSSPPQTAIASNWQTPPVPPQRAVSSVWAVPEVDGNPAFAFQEEPAGSPARPEGLADRAGGSAAALTPSHVTPPAAAIGMPPSALPAAPQSSTAERSGTQAIELPAPPQAQARGASAAPAALPAPPANGFAPFAAPTRASLFWDAVAAPAYQAAGFPPPSGTAAAPSNTPAVQSQAQPLDLDAIADALHAIADLRGVAR